MWAITIVLLILVFIAVCLLDNPDENMSFSFHKDGQGPPQLPERPHCQSCRVGLLGCLHRSMNAKELHANALSIYLMNVLL